MSVLTIGTLEAKIREQSETIKGYQSVVNIANASNATQQRCIDNLKKTIKGLDRATVEYTRIIAERDAEIARLNKELDAVFGVHRSTKTQEDK